MAQNSEIVVNSNEKLWEDLYKVSLSPVDKAFGIRKYVTLKKLNSSEFPEPFLLADIRGFLNGKPTTSGVCLTPYEYDWLVNVLLYYHGDEHKLDGKKAARSLVVRPKFHKSAVEVLQQVNDKLRRINLFKNEIKIIIERYGAFYSLLEEMEVYKEGNGYDTVF